MSQNDAPLDDTTPYEILRSIRRIVRRVSDHSRALSRGVGLTVPQLLCLKAVGDATEDEVTPVLLSRRVQLTPATVSGILDRLERDGFLVRSRRSRDRRKVCLTLTERGRQVYAQLPAPVQQNFMHRLLALQEPERAGLLASLHRVVDLMEGTQPEPFAMEISDLASLEALAAT